MNHPFKAWKVHPSDGRLSPWVYGEEADDRTDTEKLKDAVDAHIANKALLDAICSGPVSPSEAAMGAAEKAFENSEAELMALVEDITLVPYAKLLKAMSA